MDGAQRLQFSGMLSGRLTTAEDRFIRCGNTASGAYVLSLQGSIGSDDVELQVSAGAYHGPGAYSERLYASLWSPPVSRGGAGIWARRLTLDPATLVVDRGERKGSMDITFTSTRRYGEDPVVVSGRWSCPAGRSPDGSYPRSSAPSGGPPSPSPR